MDHPFRSAAVGGFNKQDVLTFLEEQSRQSSQAQQELSGRLEEAERECEDLRQERDSLRRQVEQLQGELEDLRQERDGLRVQLDTAERDLTACQRQISQAQQERDEVQAQLDGLRPDAEAYTQIKERTVVVELDAHRRALAIQEKAEEDAQRVRRQVEQWLHRMEREYSDMRGEVELSASHAVSELERVRAGLGRLTKLVADQESALAGITKVFDDTAAPTKPEAPMPLLDE